MRRPLDPERLRRVIAELGRSCRGGGTMADVRAMLELRLIGCEALQLALEEMEPRLARFPRVDPAELRARLAEVCP